MIVSMFDWFEVKFGSVGLWDVVESIFEFVEGVFVDFLSICWGVVVKDFFGIELFNKGKVGRGVWCDWFEVGISERKRNG